MRQIQLQCAVCDSVMPHNQPTPNHVVHGLVTLFLLGLWLPVWIIVAIGSGKDPATCVKCGNRRAPTGTATIASAPVVVAPVQVKEHPEFFGPKVLVALIGAAVIAVAVAFVLTFG